MVELTTVSQGQMRKKYFDKYSEDEQQQIINHKNTGRSVVILLETQTCLKT
jgi:hypothetical protein